MLGTVQGLTEFLPVSSSAHLILARTFLGWDVAGEMSLAFDVACHVGTLAAVVLYFRHDLASLAGAAATPTTWFTGGDDYARMLRCLAIGTVPIALVGITMGDFITESLRTAEVAGVSLAVGAVVMLAAERAGVPRTRDEKSLGSVGALGLGLAQALALVPGVSRSGAVLTVAMLMGMRRERAARFAFLLGVPAIVAAAAKAALDLVGQSLPEEAALLFVIGIASSGVVGYLAVKYFIRYISRYSLDVFAVYRLGLAASVIVWAVRS